MNQSSENIVTRYKNECFDRFVGALQRMSGSSSRASIGHSAGLSPRVWSPDTHFVPSQVSITTTPVHRASPTEPTRAAVVKSMWGTDVRYPKLFVVLQV